MEWFLPEPSAPIRRGDLLMSHTRYASLIEARFESAEKR